MVKYIQNEATISKYLSILFYRAILSFKCALAEAPVSDIDAEKSLRTF